MKSETRVRVAKLDHESKSITEETLKGLKEQHPEKSEDYWKGYFSGIDWAYRWVLDD